MGIRLQKKTWTEEGQTVNINRNLLTMKVQDYRYFVEDEGVEVGMYFYVTRQFGKVF
jgi:hypothetical protein